MSYVDQFLGKVGRYQEGHYQKMTRRSSSEDTKGSSSEDTKWDIIRNSKWMDRQ
jgi:hypothetical protein